MLFAIAVTNKALKIDLTKSSRLKNRMVKQLKSVESKLSIYLGTMVEHGKFTLGCPMICT